MIEFKGKISGVAEAFFWKKARALTIRIFYIALIVLLPVFVPLYITAKSWALLIVYISMFVVIPLIALIPKSDKEKEQFLPARIYTEGEYISCIFGKVEDYRKISDVSQIVDHGEFYELRFPVGKVSEKFICQKDLLSQGTLDEFEALFEDKLVRK